MLLAARMACSRWRNHRTPRLRPSVALVGERRVGLGRGCGVVVGRVNGWPKIVPNGADGQPDAKVLAAARYHDAMNFATRAKAAGIVTVGFIDTTCPPSSVYAAYNALPGKKEIFNDPPSGHAVRAAAGEAMRKAILAHVEGMRKARR